MYKALSDALKDTTPLRYFVRDRRLSFRVKPPPKKSDTNPINTSDNWTVTFSKNTSS